ncbi:capZ-interacting protein isoform X3 [Rhinolophus ferrumequinum]|uniref:capZ-interacting protein isoform X3 n=1 Tax=Rhinolophus ferrumequinum TaxID=59479 RepID=UPI00140FF5A5|nr:capZ-interacting protein isoform X3 [Rhinolophus ferrumequinum]
MRRDLPSTLGHPAPLCLMPGACTVQPQSRAKERPAETNASVDSSAPPSVAQLAGRFREQEAAAKEMPASKPTRRKPPCSLPLFPPRVELGQNGEEKSPNTSHPPKVKVKSSPLIEKLQANLVFDPAALLPGASPKSPGLKAVLSPFHSPPSTPSSPGVRSRASEAEAVPVSFDQPPEGSHLPCYNKVRTRGSIKRRPPSRRFRRSQSDCGELGDFRAPESSQENGAQEENGDEVFPSQSKAPGSPPASEGAVGREGSTPGSHEKPPLRRTTSRTEKQEQKGQAAEEDPQPDKPAQEAQEKALEPASASSAEAKSGCGSPMEASTAGEQTEEPTQGKAEMETTGPGEEEPGQKSQDKKPLQEEGAGEQETPQIPPGGAEAGLTPKEGQGKEKQDEVPILEPGCNPRTGQAQAETSSEVPETEGDTSVEDTKM